MGLGQKLFFTVLGIAAIAIAILRVVDYQGIMVDMDLSDPRIETINIHIPIGLSIEISSILLHLPFMLLNVLCIVLLLVGCALLLEAWNDGYLPFRRPR